MFLTVHRLLRARHRKHDILAVFEEQSFAAKFAQGLQGLKDLKDLDSRLACGLVGRAMKKVTHAGANRETRMKLFYLERELQNHPPWRSKAEEIVEGANAFVPNLPLLWLNISAVPTSEAVFWGWFNAQLNPERQLLVAWLQKTPKEARPRPFRTDYELKDFLLNCADNCRH